MNNNEYNSKKIVPDVQANKVSYGKGNSKKFVVVHETDNPRSGADADAHARLQYNGNSRKHRATIQ
ncbi:hypothetical protein ACIQ7N_04190 [Lysinibacillus sp. NPDC095746]|uniref:hypothetical protein n=1 Tax=Lysinibacillus sp. NPDC095746 TaxID=3364134 RepID=UPI0038100F20